MINSNIVRTAGAVLLVGALSGCVDVTVEMQVVDETHGIGSTSIAMDRAFYDANVAPTGGGDFCEEEDTLTLTPEAATCVSTEEGTFEELFANSEADEPTPTVSVVSPGMVRVTFPTGQIGEELNSSGADPQELAMMTSFFEGREINFVISGGNIVESNMTIADDGQSARLTVPFLDLITGEGALPDETFAIVDLN